MSRKESKDYKKYFKEDKNKYFREYYKNNREEYMGYLKKYQNSKKGKKKIREWAIENKDKLKNWRRNYEQKKRENDPSFNIKKKFRVRLRRVILRYLKTGKVIKPRVDPIFYQSNLNYEERVMVGIEGIDYEKIIEHLKPFPKNFSKYYQIDHIVPLNEFDFNNANDIVKAFAPKNHQILTIKQNQSKGYSLS